MRLCMCAGQVLTTASLSITTLNGGEYWYYWWSWLVGLPSYDTEHGDGIRVGCFQCVPLHSALSRKCYSERCLYTSWLVWVVLGFALDVMPFNVGCWVFCLNSLLLWQYGWSLWQVTRCIWYPSIWQYVMQYGSMWCNVVHSTLAGGQLLAASAWAHCDGN